jgi:acyl-CoA reductase-like NAD-dependent aldehyde dehydrogenase
LVSFTGSTNVGRHVSTEVHRRLGRTILELGGNNASIVMPDADVDLAL